MPRCARADEAAYEQPWPHVEQLGRSVAHFSLRRSVANIVRYGLGGDIDLDLRALTLAVVLAVGSREANDAERWSEPPLTERAMQRCREQEGLAEASPHRPTEGGTLPTGRIGATAASAMRSSTRCAVSGVTSKMVLRAIRLSPATISSSFRSPSPAPTAYTTTRVARAASSRTWRSQLAFEASTHWILSACEGSTAFA